MSQGPAKLLSAFEDLELLNMRAGKLLTYVVMAHHVDTADQAAARRYGQVLGRLADCWAAGVFRPGAIGHRAREAGQWMAAEPTLAVYRQYFDDLFRRQSHVRSTEVETLLGMLADPCRAHAPPPTS